MKTSRGIVWGGLLIILGTFWLLRNMNLIHIDWNTILPYWPILLILAGVILLISKSKDGISGAAVTLLITLAVFGGIINKKNQRWNRNNWSFNLHDNDNDQEEDFDLNEDTNPDESYLKDRGKQNRQERTYKADMFDYIEKATFNLEGGAGSFSIDGNTPNLFSATTQSTLLGFVSNTSMNVSSKSAIVNFKMEDGNIKIKNGEMTNEAKIHLNEAPVWTIDLGIGAGEGDFDFSNYKIEKLKVSTGVADMDLKLGDKLENTEVNIEAGVASVTLKVPENTGCEMHFEGAMNSKNLNNLEKISEGLYRSPGYDQAKNKVQIKYEGGLTSFKISRY